MSAGNSAFTISGIVAKASSEANLNLLVLSTLKSTIVSRLPVEIVWFKFLTRKGSGIFLLDDKRLDVFVCYISYFFEASR